MFVHAILLEDKANKQKTFFFSKQNEIKSNYHLLNIYSVSRYFTYNSHMVAIVSFLHMKMLRLIG